jgi:hypothetical protein
VTASYNQITGTYDYGSIVRALQAQMDAAGTAPVKEYPYNYQGITQAIQDLTFVQTQNPGADIGPSPSMGDVVIDENGDPQFNYSDAPLNGDLWFDTRQGRLFIAYESTWYQTNGGDGLTIITATDTPPSASNLALGQLWFSTSNGVLYIWAGTYEEPDGSIVTVPTATTVPVWQQLVDTSDVQTSQTLPLTGTGISAAIVDIVDNSHYLPKNVNPANITFQDDANQYFVDALDALDTQVYINRVTVGTEPPANPVDGQLWLDTTDIELSVWYQTGSYGQWVPTFSAATQDENIATLQQNLTRETARRVQSVSALDAIVNSLNNTVTNNYTTVVSSINSLTAQVNALDAPPDLTPYITEAEEQGHITDLQKQVTSLTADISTLYSTQVSDTELATNVANLQSQINADATLTELAAVEAKIPSLVDYAKTTYVDSQIAANKGLTSTDSTLKGTITVDKTDIANAAFDFSTADWDGRKSLKYKSNCHDSYDHFVTFGTTDLPYEYAWEFDGGEDFCWKYNDTKVASIANDGIAATNFFITEFGTNTDAGRTLVSTIDVGAHISLYKTALQELRTAAASSSTLADLKTAIATALANV